jgi:hypothetical protein
VDTIQGRRRRAGLTAVVCDSRCQNLLYLQTSEEKGLTKRHIQVYNIALLCTLRLNQDYKIRSWEADTAHLTADDPEYPKFQKKRVSLLPFEKGYSVTNIHDRLPRSRTYHPPRETISTQSKRVNRERLG